MVRDEEAGDEAQAGAACDDVAFGLDGGAVAEAGGTAAQAPGPGAARGRGG